MANNIDFEALENNEYDYTPKTSEAHYFKYKGRKYFVHFPSEVNSDTTIYVAGHGYGENGVTHARRFFSSTKDQNIICIEPIAVDNMSDFTNIPEIAEAFAKHYNIDMPSITMSGHSATGVNALKGAEAVIKATDAPTFVVLNDGHNTYEKVKVDSSVFKDSLVLGFQPVRGANLKTNMGRLKEIAKAGGKVLICTYSNTTEINYGPFELNHGASNEVAATFKAYDMDSIQLVDSGKVKLRNGNVVDALYTYKYIDSDGKVHNFKNAEEAQAYLDDARVVINGSLYEKCSTLAEYANRYSGSADTLGSNLSYVSDAMNAIKSKIIEHTDINYVPDGEANIIGTLYKASNYYGTVTNVLYGNLSAEADAIYGIANAIYQMDGASSLIAETTLSDGMKGLFSSSNPTISASLNELKTNSANLFDTAKSAVTASGRYDELSNLLGTTIQEGGVGKISTKSLETAISTIIPNLENEINKATGIKSSVSEFMSGIGTSNILQGDTWDAVKVNMDNYSSLLDCNVKAATFISDTIKTAMGMIANYINGAADTLRKVGTTDFGAGVALDEIDDSKLPALEAELINLQNEINRLSDIVTSMEASRHEVVDKKQNEEGEWVIIGSHQEPSEAEIQGYRDQLVKVQNIKDILDSYAGVLRGFAPVVKGAQDIINDAISQVKNAYENPTVDTQGNQTFNSDFKLDLSKYGIDSEIDYKKLVEDYHGTPNLETAADTNNPVGTQEKPSTDKSDNNGNSNTNPDTQNNPDNYDSPSNPINYNQWPSSRQPSNSSPSERKQGPVNTPRSVSTEPIIIVEEPKQSQVEATNLDEVVIPDEKPPIIEIKDNESNVIKLSNAGGYDNKPTNQYVEQNVNYEEPIIDNQDEIIQNQIDEPIVDIEQNEYIESELPQQPPIVEITPQVEQPISQSQQSTTIKSMGIASGVGLALGAAALGTHSIIKKKDDDLDEEDYGFDK